MRWTMGYDDSVTIDHVKPAFLCEPYEYGDAKNERAACYKCNHAKGIVEWRLKRVIDAIERMITHWSPSNI